MVSEASTLNRKVTWLITLGQCLLLGSVKAISSLKASQTTTKLGLMRNSGGRRTSHLPLIILPAFLNDYILKRSGGELGRRVAGCLPKGQRIKSVRLVRARDFVFRTSLVLPRYDSGLTRTCSSHFTVELWSTEFVSRQWEWYIPLLGRTAPAFGVFKWHCSEVHNCQHWYIFAFTKQAIVACT